MLNEKTIEEEFQLAIQKKDIHEKQKQEKENARREKIKCANNLIDDFSARLLQKLQQYAEQFNITVMSPLNLSMYGSDMPGRQFSVKLKGFPDSSISIVMREENLIKLTAQWPRFYIYCKYENNEWRFNKTPYKAVDGSYKEVVDQTEIIDFSEAAAVVLKDVIFAMGEKVVEQ